MSETVDTREKAIIGFIAKNPGASVYRIYEGLKKTRKVEIGNRIFVLRRVNILANKGFLRMEKGPRNANPSWLTFKGLMYAIQTDAIDPKDAGTVEVAHNLKPKYITCHQYGPQKTVCLQYELTELEPQPEKAHAFDPIERFKEQHPEIFFKVLSTLPNILNADKDNINSLSCLAMFLSGYYRYLTDEKYYVECQQNEFEIGCWSMSSGGRFELPFTFIFETLLKNLGFKLPDPPLYKRHYPELEEDS